jgi:hypothetical protein
MGRWSLRTAGPVPGGGAPNPEVREGDALEYPDSVGVGAYRIDLHPSTGGRNYVDIPSKPFEIPLGSLIPVRMDNLLPAAKNIGTTHITNGCYRLHPVEWNIGEAAGSLVAYCLAEKLAPYCLAEKLAPRHVAANPRLTQDFQDLLCQHGVELHWPRLHPL